MTRWWQLKYFRNFHPENWGRWTHLDYRIFFRWVGSKPPTRFFLDSWCGCMFQGPLKLMEDNKFPQPAGQLSRDSFTAVVVPFISINLKTPRCLSKNARISHVFQVPGKPSVLFFKATLPLKPATIALKIGHLAFQVVFCWQPPGFTTFLDFHLASSFVLVLEGYEQKRTKKQPKMCLIGSMFGIFTYIWLISMVNVDKYQSHGSYGCEIVCRLFFVGGWQVVGVATAHVQWDCCQSKLKKTTRVNGNVHVIF